MNPKNKTQTKQNVGGPLFEELFLEFILKKYNISKKEFLAIADERQNINNSIPASILRTSKLSSLEATVKFLREDRKLSYYMIGQYIKRKPKTLAVTYSVARRKMPESFPKEIETDTVRIPFTAFSEKLSILECICKYLKSLDNSYAEISRLLGKDQRTVWTVCKRSEKKLGLNSLKKDSKQSIRTDNGK